jgi:hypothetical protein
MSVLSIDSLSGFELQTQTLVGRSIAVLGITGSGKTNTAAVLIEELLSNDLPLTIVDIEGEYWGLKERFEILVAGRSEHAELEISTENAGKLAEISVKRGISVILDLSDFTQEESYEFPLEYFKSLWTTSSNIKQPYQIVLEEAHEFCMTVDTEILTPNGWARWNEVGPGDQVVGFEPTTGTYSDETIQCITSHKYEGEMVALQTKSLDCLVTPDHRVVLRRIQRASPERYRVYGWTFCEARKVPSCVQIPIGGAPEGEGIEGLSDEFLRIMGWIITDGYFHQKRYSSTLGLQQSTSTMKCGKSILDEMDKVLTANPNVRRISRPARQTVCEGKTLNGTPSVSFYFGRILSKQLLVWLGNDIHRIPRYILRHGSRKQLSSLFQGLLEGDGSSSDGKWKTFYAGINEGLANDFQELATRLGINTVKSYMTNADGPGGQWRVCIAWRQHHHVRKPISTYYEGLVWDIKVPTGAFVSRRHGTVFVTGNCPQGTHALR